MDYNKFEIRDPRFEDAIQVLYETETRRWRQAVKEFSAGADLEQAIAHTSKPFLQNYLHFDHRIGGIKNAANAMAKIRPGNDEWASVALTFWRRVHEIGIDEILARPKWPPRDA